MRFAFAILAAVLSSLQGWANVVGVDTQNFNPTSNGLDFVTVQSSETLEPGVFNFGFFLNYATNTLPNYTDQATQERGKTRDKLISSDLNFGLGLMPGWDVGISFPAVLSQEVEADVFKGVFDKTGMTDIRLNTKVRLLGDKDGGIATIFTLEFPQVQNNPFYGNTNSPTYNFELAADTTFNKIAVGANVGYRIRNTGDPIAGVPISPIGNMWIASLAASYLFTSIDTKLITEVFASFPTENTVSQTDRELSSAEWLVGIKHDINTQVALHTGVSTGITHGTFSPDIRVYGGINWAMGPWWGKKEPPVVATTMQPVPPSGPKVVAPVEPQPITTVDTTPDQGGFLADRAPDDRELFIVKHINFKTDSNRIPLDFRDYLKNLADYLNKPPMFKRLVVTGHTDSVGPDAYNLRLSRARAHTVKRALVELYGLPADQIETEGYGEERPIADNGNYQGRAQNRRVEFFIER